MPADFLNTASGVLALHHEPRRLRAIDTLITTLRPISRLSSAAQKCLLQNAEVFEFSDGERLFDSLSVTGFDYYLIAGGVRLMRGSRCQRESRARAAELVSLQSFQQFRLQSVARLFAQLMRVPSGFLEHLMEGSERPANISPSVEFADLQECDFEAGLILGKPGNQANIAYRIICGSISLRTHEESPVSATLGPGNYCGEEMLCNGGRYEALMSVNQSARVVLLDEQQLQEEITQYPLEEISSSRFSTLIKQGARAVDVRDCRVGKLRDSYEIPLVHLRCCAENLSNLSPLIICGDSLHQAKIGALRLQGMGFDVAVFTQSFDDFALEYPELSEQAWPSVVNLPRPRPRMPWL